MHPMVVTIDSMSDVLGASVRVDLIIPEKLCRIDIGLLFRNASVLRSRAVLTRADPNFGADDRTIDYDRPGDRVYVIIVAVEYHVAHLLVGGKLFGLDGREAWHVAR